MLSPATTILEGWYILHLKGGIHSSAWSTKTFAYNVREPRYKQNNKGYNISRIWNNEQSHILKSDTAAIHKYCSYEYFMRLGIFHLTNDILRQISSSNPYLYNIMEPKYKQSDISTPQNHTQMFLYSRQSYEFNLLNVICTIILVCL